jgi:hypothetical protein
MRLFHICTIVNDENTYSRMRQSFAKAGFDEDRCRFSKFDNTRSNCFEPYSTFNNALASTTEPYLIFCHQDVLADRGQTIEDLLRAIAELNTRDKKWAVAGNAGGTETLRMAMKITDGNGVWKVGRLPREVQSLDENFILVRQGAGAMASEELDGFHLYATDICLNARRRGGSCYVIDFHLTHLSNGKAAKGFDASLKRFVRLWAPRTTFAYVLAPCTFVFLSRYPFVSQIFGSAKVSQYIIGHPRIYGAFSAARRLLHGRGLP